MEHSDDFDSKPFVSGHTALVEKENTMTLEKSDKTWYLEFNAS